MERNVQTSVLFNIDLEVFRMISLKSCQ